MSHNENSLPQMPPRDLKKKFLHAIKTAADGAATTPSSKFIQQYVRLYRYKYVHISLITKGDIAAHI